MNATNITTHEVYSTENKTNIDEYQRMRCTWFFDIIPYSAGSDFSRQNLKSVDVKFWRLKSFPAL